MFVVFVGSLLTTCCGSTRCAGAAKRRPAFIGAVALWLWFTVLFANFAEAMAEGRSKAQANALRGKRQRSWAKQLNEPRHGSGYYTQPAASCAAATSCWSKRAT